jgi:hypothetical protein
MQAPPRGRERGIESAPRQAEVRPYFKYALAATGAVLLLPFMIVVLILWLSNPDPHPLVTGLVGAGISISIATAGSAIWMRRPESADISFGELMIWGFWRRRRAEVQLEEGTALLGLDRSGTPQREPRVTRAQQLEVLRDLSSAIEAKDPYTHGHSQRVERHSYRTALAMGLSVSDIEDLRKAAALHDVGKVRVPDRVLRKPEDLTIEERRLVEDHVLVGAWMVSRVGSAQVVEAVRHHHERWDGLGYPDGLAGTDIPLFARVIAVADSYDAMTSTRPYRAGLGRRNAVDVLREESGTQWDPVVVEAFLSTLAMPVPVAGILAFLPFPRLGREIAVLLKRVGAASLAPAASAAGAAAVLGASVVGVPTDLPHQAPAAQHRIEVSSPSYSDEGLPDRVEELVLGERVRKRPAKKIGVAGSQIQSFVNEPQGALQDSGPNDEPQDGVVPAGPTRDPNPLKGRDCVDHPGQGTGGGNPKHCGPP